MWVSVGNASEFRPGTARVVHTGGQTLALITTPGGLFAMDNACPHQDGPLGEGSVDGSTLTCPLHGWQFNCTSGACLSEKRNPQRTYPVKVDGTEVLVEVPDAQPDVKADAAGASQWQAVAELSKLPLNAVRKVQAGGKDLVLAHTSEGVFALDHGCIHEGGPLSEGTLLGTRLSCPLHGWEFDCRTGQCTTDKRHRQGVRETKIEAGQVWLRVGMAQDQPKVPPHPREEMSSVEKWKIEKHGIDVWPDVERYASNRTPMPRIDTPELERMKWYGYFYRKTNDLNHYMCRIRIPGCEMTSEQARAIAYIAYQSGYSIVDVTTRGNVQVQGLTIENLPGVRTALEAVGLTSRQSGHDNVRNVTSHPYSGIDPAELMDTRALAREIQDLIIGNRDLSDLPRKFNISMTGRPEAPSHLWTQDLAFVAVEAPNGAIGFQLLLGGKQGQTPHVGWHLPVFVRPDQVLPVTDSVLRTFRELGYRHNRTEVRFRYLIERLGLDGVRAEIETRLGSSLPTLAVAPPRPKRDECIGWFKQKQPGLWAAGVCVTVGRLSWDEFEGLAIVARDYGSGKIRTTADQNLVITDIPEAARETVGHALARHGLTFEPDSVVRNTVSCTGKQFCNIAVTETKGYAYRLMEELRRRKVHLHDIKLHISGCPSSCANSYTADIGLKGTKIRRRLRVVDAFDIYLAGGVGSEVQLGTLYRKSVPFDEVAGVLEAVIREYYQKHADMESFSHYWHHVLQGHKPGPEREELPAWRCAGCGYRHVASDPPPFCPMCSAIRAKFEPDEVKAEAAVQTEPPVDEAIPVEPAAPVKPVASAKPAGRRVVIVGGSIAGHTAAQTARSLDQNAAIALITDEPVSFYNRLNLTRYLAGEVSREQLFDYGLAWYREQRVDMLTRTRVIGLDPVHKTLLLHEGREMPYDACILAHGSAATVPPFCRGDLPGVWFLRTLDDTDGMLASVQPGARVAVIGGGVLALEAAFGMAKRGAVVQVFEYQPRLMPRQLDSRSAELLRDRVTQKGITSHVRAAVKEILGKDRIHGIRLEDGRTFGADLVIVSTGIAPNIDWVKRSGIHCSRGVIVNERMQTSAPDVYAAGDVVEWGGQVIGLWNPALEQAQVAATNAVGQSRAFEDKPPVTILKCLGIPLVSIGEVCEDEGAVTSEAQQDGASGTYRRLIFRHGVPIGAILLGTLSGMGELRKLVEHGWQLGRLTQQVMRNQAFKAAS